VAEREDAVGQHGVIAISYLPAKVVLPQPITWKEGQNATLKLADYAASDIQDPQGVLGSATVENGELQGTVACEPGARLLFLKSGTEACPLWPSADRARRAKAAGRQEGLDAAVVKAGDLSVGPSWI